MLHAYHDLTCWFLDCLELWIERYDRETVFSSDLVDASPRDSYPIQETAGRKYEYSRRSPRCCFRAPSPQR